MDVYYHVQFQLCITSGSKVSRGAQIGTPGIGCDQTPPGIGLRARGEGVETLTPKSNKRDENLITNTP